MKENNFVFADLSTYDVKVAKDFYNNVFRWDYPEDQSSYSIATFKGAEVAGIYETPQKFKEMKMPSFWMSYIQVNNLDQTIETAKSMGGIIELVDKNQPIGKVALIRDPLGAGFTVYEGDLLNSRFSNRPSSLVWNELFISDFSKIRAFYSNLFNWKFEDQGQNRFFIKNSKNESIGAVQELSTEVKGKKEYWSVFFCVEDIEDTKQLITSNDGQILYEDESNTVAADPFGAFFHLSKANANQSPDTLATKSPSNPSTSIKAIFGLLLIGTSLITGWTWIWAIFFAFWVYSDLKSSYTHMFEPISKKKQPFFYWIIVLLWATLGAYSVYYDYLNSANL